MEKSGSHQRSVSSSEAWESTSLSNNNWYRFIKIQEQCERLTGVKWVRECAMCVKQRTFRTDHIGRIKADRMRNIMIQKKCGMPGANQKGVQILAKTPERLCGRIFVTFFFNLQTNLRLQFYNQVVNYSSLQYTQHN